MSFKSKAKKLITGAIKNVKHSMSYEGRLESAEKDLAKARAENKLARIKAQTARLRPKQDSMFGGSMMGSSFGGFSGGKMESAFGRKKKNMFDF